MLAQPLVIPMVRLVAISVLIGMLLPGCDATVQPPPPPSPPDTLAVHAVLHSGRSTQRALVSRPLPVDGGDEGEDIQHVQDATVRIGGRGLPVLPPDSTANYTGTNLLGRGANYEADPFRVAPGDTYTLQVTREETEITGTTRAPGSFAVTVDSMTVRWTRSTGAAEYALRVRRYDEDGDVQYRNVSPIRTREQAVPLDTSQFSNPFQPGRHAITVIAADSNLARYRQDAIQQSGLEGGLGVFGAVTVLRDTVSLPATDENERRTGGPLLRSPQRDATGS